MQEEIDDAAYAKILIEFSELEYMHNVKLEDALVLLDVYKDDIKDFFRDCKESIASEKFSRVIHGVLAVLGFEDQRDLNDLQVDTYVQELAFASKILACYDSLSDALSNENYQDVIHLIRFTNQKYLSNLRYYEDKHKAIEFSCSHIGYQGFGGSDQNEFFHFFQQQMRKIPTTEKKCKVNIYE